MKRDKEFDDAFNWLACVDVNSEAEAVDREIILSTIEEYEETIDRAVEYMKEQGLSIYDIKKILKIEE